MRITSETYGRFTIATPNATRITATDLAVLKAACRHVAESGQAGVLIDLGSVLRIARSGFAALLDMQNDLSDHLTVAFFGASAGVARDWVHSALAPLLPLYANREEALRAPRIRKKLLAGVRAVVLVAGLGTRMGPVGQDTPKPLLDILGETVLHRAMARLEEFGVRDFLLNPGHLGAQIHTHIEISPYRNTHFFNEGAWVGTEWTAAPRGSASTLLEMHMRSDELSEDFIVVCGDVLSDVDFAHMMAVHQHKGADVTVAAQHVPNRPPHMHGIMEVDADGGLRVFGDKSNEENAPSTLASTGMYVVSPRALIFLPRGPYRRIRRHLLPEVLKNGGRIQAYQGANTWEKIECGRSYYRTVSRALRGLVPGVAPNGREIRPYVWAATGAEVSSKAELVGPCFIGQGAVIEAHARVEGASVIGAGAKLQARSLVRRSIVMPRSEVRSGTCVDEMIVAPNWAISHRSTLGGSHSQVPLDGVCHRQIAETPFEAGDARPPKMAIGL